MDYRLRDLRGNVLEFRAPPRPLRRPQLQLLVRTEQCTACGACLEACMFDAIAVEDTVSIDRDRCGLCGACIAACPEGALTWSPPTAK